MVYKIGVIIIVVIVPSLLNYLQYHDENQGMIWLLLHQLYYYPLGCWVPHPFFRIDGDIAFTVLLPGRFLTAFIYFTLLESFRRLVYPKFRRGVTH